jgi:hypothetical protein
MDKGNLFKTSLEADFESLRRLIVGSILVVLHPICNFMLLRHILKCTYLLHFCMVVSISHPILIFSLENILPMFCLEDCQPIFKHFANFDYFQPEDLLLSFFIFSIDPCHSFEHILVFKSTLVSISSRENILWYIEIHWWSKAILCYKKIFKKFNGFVV